MREGAAELTELLYCLLYTAVTGTAEEKEELLQTWLACPDQPYLIVTSALSTRFDYTYICLVIYMDKLYSLVDFVQESGQARQDRKEAYLTVLLLT
jgi:superfamily II DNA helicase RecQ